MGSFAVWDSVSDTSLVRRRVAEIGGFRRLLGFLGVWVRDAVLLAPANDFWVVVAALGFAFLKVRVPSGFHFGSERPLDGGCPRPRRCELRVVVHLFDALVTYAEKEVGRARGARRGIAPAETCGSQRPS